MTDKIKVLFLCRQNSGRIQIAEGLLRQLDGKYFDVYSAGSEPAPQVNKFAIQALENNHIDIGYGPKTKNCSVVTGMDFGYVFVLCNETLEDCLKPQENAVIVHWELPGDVRYS